MPPDDGNVEGVRCPQGQVEPAEKSFRVDDIRGLGSESRAEPRGPGIEIGKACMRGFGAELAHSNEARERRSKLRRRKIAHDEGARVRGQKLVGIRRERVLDEDRDKKAGVEVKAHRQSSSRIRETSVPASIDERVRTTRFAANQS